MRGDPRIEIGRIARAHGIRGEVVIVTHDPESDLLDELPAIWVGGVERRMTGARGTHRGWLVQLEGIATRNDAETLRGLTVEVERAALALGDCGATFEKPLKFCGECGKPMGGAA